MRIALQNLRAIGCRSASVVELKSPGRAFQERKSRERAEVDLDARVASLRARLAAKFGDRHIAVVALDEATARARAARA
ncbi:hypothetical protein D9M68_612240 [compost metagenome]